MTEADRNPDLPWWRGAAIYQIYPRSFLDTNGDGVGDLAGIARNMGHIASLGVDAIWISPFFTSPMRDFGYDVADFCDVDPVFGTLGDFDRVVEVAHAHGLRVLIDQVYAHTSDLHPWFAESRSAVENPRSDWYVWADPNEDGTPPCNWQSVFGGPAWTWDGRRRQYYMHTFLKEQPQLNVHNPQVQDALLGVARFWLERGVDGFRLDALNHSMHDPQLRDNPPAPHDGRQFNRPFDYQLKIHSQSQPGIVGFIERIRGLCDDYGAIFTMAEVGGEKSEIEMKAFTAGDHRLNSAYGFNFLYSPALTPALVADAMAQWQGLPGEDGLAEGWPSWAFENHDAPRAVSRWCAMVDMDHFARMKLALLASLRGDIILYQGEELGLEQDEIPFHLLQDPEAIANWPLTLSRDGARTPMPWIAGAEQGGFTSGTPWLPLSAPNLERAVDVQEQDGDSILNLTRQLLALRKAHPALHHGSFGGCIAAGNVLSFEREADGQLVRCIYNFSPEPVDLAELDGIEPGGQPLLSLNPGEDGQLGGYAALWLVV
ncbi:alpha-glucosidase [Erythrobacter sp. SG61-1L]|uniref:alpha-amylase family glycosyl hydrolase n=1 Tax=Erythrobacter sp. SG61-1L TaxID=1603897 RepID=UPI0006C8F867|nr:alpha-amylase family glycosyl hydrolase [Erythrobacter sp. SG61-1L]KPL66920.1 alpha-glucosidase [Erythrobacter sp. SG61-1L]